jgi:hypothetical protein
LVIGHQQAIKMEDLSGESGNCRRRRMDDGSQLKIIKQIKTLLLSSVGASALPAGNVCRKEIKK